MEKWITPEAYTYFIYFMFLIFAVSAFYVFGPAIKSKVAAKKIKAELNSLSKFQDVTEKFNQFNEWMTQSKNLYVKEKLLPAWESYYQQYIYYQQKGIAYTPDVYDFFFEESLVHSFGKRKYAEIVAGIFLSLGIVGTFFGISVGVSGLHVDGNSDAMQSGIGVLLSGMKVKFRSSIAGVLLSLGWQYLDKRHFFPMLTESFSDIRHSLDEAFPTQDQSTLLYSMDQRQEKQMQDFQAFLSDVLIPNMVNGIASSVQQSLEPQMQQTQQMMSELMQTTSLNQAQGMQTMVNQFVNQLNELTGDHMKNLGEALNSTLEWQKNVQTELAALVQSMQESAVGQMAMVEKTTLLTSQIHEYTERITDYQSVLEKTAAELSGTTDKNSELQKVTTGLLERMTEERRLFHEYFDIHLSSLKENVDSITGQTGLQVTVQQRLEENLQRISNITESQQTLAVTLAQQADLSQRSNQELEVIFDKFTQHNSEFVHIQDNLKSLLQEIQQERVEMDGISIRIQDTLTGQLENMESRVEQLSQVWESASDSMAKTNKHLETSMNQFADDMHRGLQNTFNLFDQELTKSVQHLASGVEAIQEGVIDLPDAMQTLKQAVNEINRQSKRIMNPITME
ncbi:hypothetical protein PSTEL_04140 [Paenibacillus stellifer]|uniref:MotA/TolQ/ExbB proton channel domain-containing protein n=1 Tax=Paenibacillus stellifer TaxID=169760 RepID=A0A089LLM9_9BACL|nr:hypothetical protein [Paenibacillus stellifer]AIQ62416.1 hypothetical protein PSTEL_04140 [Paenibacillus stellifer]